MNPLYREDVTHPACGRAGCNHMHGPMFVHARCHIYAPVQCTLEGDVLTVRCSLCSVLVSHFRVELEPGEDLSLANACHPNVPLDCSYEDGHLHLTCHRCDTRVVSLPLARRERVTEEPNEAT